MVEPTMSPEPQDARRRRVRIILASSFLICLVAVLGYLTYAVYGVNQMERRIVAGDFPYLRLETHSIQVATDGRVLGPEIRTDRFVASLKLIPPGSYRAMLIADDGVAAHTEKAELVIAAQDDKGQWHPDTAPTLLDRLRSPRPGVAK